MNDDTRTARAGTDEVRAVRAVRADARINRERIIRAARELIAEEGVEVSFNAVAQRAGVGNATLYRHFATQQELREAVFIARVTESSALLTELAELRDPGAELRRYLEWVLATADLSLVGLGLIRQPYAPAVAGEADHLNDLLDDLVRRCHQAGLIRPGLDRDALVVATVALVHLGRTATVPAERKAEFLDTVLRGLG